MNPIIPGFTARPIDEAEHTLSLQQKYAKERGRVQELMRVVKLVQSEKEALMLERAASKSQFQLINDRIQALEALGQSVQQQHVEIVERSALVHQNPAQPVTTTAETEQKMKELERQIAELELKVSELVRENNLLKQKQSQTTNDLVVEYMNANCDLLVENEHLRRANTEQKRMSRAAAIDYEAQIDTLTESNRKMEIDITRLTQLLRLKENHQVSEIPRVEQRLTQQDAEYSDSSSQQKEAPLKDGNIQLLASELVFQQQIVRKQKPTGKDTQ